MSDKTVQAIFIAVTAFFCFAAVFAAGVVFWHIAAWVFNTFGIVTTAGFVLSSMVALSVFLAFAFEDWL